MRKLRLQKTKEVFQNHCTRYAESKQQEAKASDTHPSFSPAGSPGCTGDVCSFNGTNAALVVKSAAPPTSIPHSLLYVSHEIGHGSFFIFNTKKERKKALQVKSHAASKRQGGKQRSRTPAICQVL